MRQKQRPRSLWTVLGSKIPRNEVEFFCQMFILFCVVLTCLITLSVKDFSTTDGRLRDLYIILLSSCLGVILPSPHRSNHVIGEEAEKKI